MLKADLHIHTKYSMDCNTPLEEIIDRCRDRGINCIAIADHGTIKGAVKMQGLAPFPVIIAEEILTPHGEIMGMFLKETIPSGLSVEETLSQIRAQDGLVCIPHPFDIRQSAMRKHVLGLAGKIDAIEVYNSKNLLPWAAAKARHFADKHGIARTAGSDAHIPGEIGKAYVEMPEFDGRNGFITALRQGTISGRPASPLTYVHSAWARVRRRF